jgi:hypothetical protein
MLCRLELHCVLIIGVIIKIRKILTDLLTHATLMFILFYSILPSCLFYPIH